MAITNTTRVVRYIGNESTTAFPYAFLIPDADSVIVSLVTLATSEATVLDGADFTITGIGDPAGGTVTYPLAGSPIASTVQLVIERSVPITQTVVITNQTRYFADVVMEVWDRLTMMVQELREESGRTLRLRVGETLSTIPDPEAGKVLLVNDAGTGLFWGPTAAEIAAAQANADAAIASASAASASAAAALAAENSLLENQGAWVGPGTAYALSDLVQPGDGSTYVCVVAHTSTGTFNDDYGAGYWAVFAAKGSPGAGTGDMLAANNLSELTSLSAARANLGLGTAAVVDVIDEDSFATDSATRPPSQQSVKAYVAASVPASPVKAWVNFNGTGTVAIRKSFNVSSITDLGVGYYRVNVTNNMASADYVIFTNGAGIDVNKNTNIASSTTTGPAYDKTVTGCRIHTGTSSAGNLQDYEEVHVMLVE